MQHNAAILRSGRLSTPQEQIWVQSRRDARAYNSPLLRGISGAIDMEAFARSVARLTARHEVLRTRFVVDSATDTPHQVVLADQLSILTVVDYSDAPDPASAVDNRTKRELLRPFDLANEPPARVFLFSAAQDRHTLLVVCHHIASDAWGHALFLDELAACYADLSRGAAAALPPVSWQPIDHAEWESKRLASESFGRDLDYWVRHLRGYEGGDVLPMDRARSEADNLIGASFSFDLDSATCSAVDALAVRRRSSTFMIVLSALFAQLFRYTGRRDFAVAVPVANRDTRESKGMIGCLVNVIALRVGLPEGVSFETLVDTVRAVALDGYERQYVPYGLVMKELGYRAGSEAGMQPQVLCHAVQAARTLVSGGLSYEPIRLPFTTTKFPFVLGFVKRDAIIRIRIDYSIDLFGEAAIAAFASDYQALISDVLAEPHKPLEAWAMERPQPASPAAANGAADKPLAAPPAPRDPELEEALADVFREVIGIERAGVDDDFFELGGNSIRAIAAQARAHRKGLLFSVESLFMNPTAATLAAHVTRREPKTPELRRLEAFELVARDDAERMPPDVVDAYPITRLQLSMLAQTARHPDRSLYSLVDTCSVCAPLDIEALREAIEVVTQCHPALRTSFALSGFRVPLQLVHETTDVPLVVTDLRGVAEPEAHLTDAVRARLAASFDVGAASFFRYDVLRLSNETSQFLISGYHALVDALSLATLRTEILRAYGRLVMGKPPAAADPTSSFAQYVDEESRAITSQPTLDFWLSEVAGGDAGAATLAYMDQVRHHSDLATFTESAAAMSGYYEFPSALARDVRAFAQLAGVPLKSVLLAANLVMVGTLSRSNDVSTGLLLQGRPDTVDGEKVIGLFVNTLPFRMKLQQKAWIDLARDVFQKEMRILSHRRFPTAELQRLTAKKLFSTTFSYERQLQSGCIEVDDETIAYEGVRQYSVLDLPLSVGIVDGGEGGTLAVVVTFSPVTAGRDIACAIIDHFVSALEHCAAAPADAATSIAGTA